MKKDKTGTNPINFSKDFRVYNEFTWLNTPGDSYNNVTTLEYRTSFADGKWQWRIRGRYSFLKADLNDDGSNEIKQNGLGDVDMRFLTVLNYNFENNTAWAAGVELFLDTATEDVLGTGANTIGPQIFFGKFFKAGCLHRVCSTGSALAKARSDLNGLRSRSTASRQTRSSSI
jgi:hypothetical protein